MTESPLESITPPTQEERYSERENDKMIFEYLKLGMDVADEAFNSIYPERINKFARSHWTPVRVAKVAAQFLAETPGAKVLDIGSGAGKFCMIGSVFTKGHFTGVEQRESLYQLSNRLLQCYRLLNVKFIHSNITQIEFREYNAFYYFNSFFENIEQSKAIDNTVEIDKHLYGLYSEYMREQLSGMPIGTRLATYWSDEVPVGYKLQSENFDGFLKMWEKTS